jgi:hypothetical protein
MVIKELLPADAVLARVEAEYRAMPTLSLTLAQARRLWNLDSLECAAAFERLTAAGFLRRNPDGRYRRASAEGGTGRHLVW